MLATLENITFYTYGKLIQIKRNAESSYWSFLHYFKSALKCNDWENLLQYLSTIANSYDMTTKKKRLENMILMKGLYHILSFDYKIDT